MNIKTWYKIYHEMCLTREKIVTMEKGCEKWVAVEVLQKRKLVTLQFNDLELS